MSVPAWRGLVEINDVTSRLKKSSRLFQMFLVVHNCPSIDDVFDGKCPV